ncbi:reverse transcriptase [Gossypium australe]|uniref:Reverse transcriptase n=1 Tax=Gossypium australe TaxID=47621 RepID=A0A5B6X772_9ROSI|nr:reverse transcriptase [Gossypium australe]
MRCVCSVTYSVSLNGCNSEWFSPSRGLRQGDSLSPFHFLICAKGFSTLISEAKQKGLMKGAPIGKARFSINHFFLLTTVFFLVMLRVRVLERLETLLMNMN